MHIPYGNNLKIYVEGESRGPFVSATIRHFPAGVSVDETGLNAFMRRRIPGTNSFSSARSETDVPEFICGIENGITTGGPIEIIIRNKDAAPSDTDYTDTPRPSHADYPAVVKYGSSVDLRGGGHFSGRLTSPLCAAGWLCLQYLKTLGISVFAHIQQISSVKDSLFDPIKPQRPVRTESGLELLNPGVEKDVLDALYDIKASRDSCGGIIECAVTGLPAGLGEHLFAGMEGRISSVLFSVPSVKAVEFGDGFGLSSMKGSEANDPYRTDGSLIFTESNHGGGIAGGMTTGMPLIVRCGLKPIPSISVPQKTVSLKNMTNTEITLRGRNDCCAVPRAVPVIEAAVAAAVADVLLDVSPSEKEGTDSLGSLRREIDIADRTIVNAYSERMCAVRAIGGIKKKSGAGVYNPEREEALLNKVRSYADPCFSSETDELYRTILGISKKYQSKTEPYLTGFEDKKAYLIGNPLGHSLSPEIHAHLSDYSYELRQIAEEELDGFFRDRNFDLLNVTIPYKKKILKYLDVISDEAAEVGAVNTVIKQKDGTLHGFNTDVHGFGSAFDAFTEKAGISPDSAIIAGNGGASAAVKYALGLRNVPYFTVSRRDAGTYRFEDIPSLCRGRKYVLINATPVGTAPFSDECVFTEEIIRGAAGVIDLVYNPIRTRLFVTAEANGVPAVCGMTMLVSQAAAAASLLTGKEIPDSTVNSTVSSVASAFENIVLIGMPGCGKSTVGRIIAGATGRRFFDTDEDVELRTGRKCGDIIVLDGEKKFRELEHESCVTASHIRRGVIATGGGAVTNPENFAALKSAGPVVWLRRDPGSLDVSGRPLSSSAGTKALYEARRAAYERFADVTVDSSDTLEKTAAAIIREINGYGGIY